jgi:hypothetical protein
MVNKFSVKIDFTKRIVAPVLLPPPAKYVPLLSKLRKLYFSYTFCRYDSHFFTCQIRKPEAL